MENIELEEHSLDLVVQRLRVPELSYLPTNTSFPKEHVDRFIQGALSSPSSCNELSILKNIKKTLGEDPLPSKLLNVAFFCDRLFDVWTRKASIDEHLSNILSRWRYPFFAQIYLSDNNAVFKAWHELLDSINEFSLTWTGGNTRFRKIILDLFTEIELALFSGSPLTESMLDVVLTRWRTFSDQHNNKKTKVLERLIISEQKKAKETLGETKAAYELNNCFSGKSLPLSLNRFIQHIWHPILCQCYATFKFEHIKEADKLNKQLAIVFRDEDAKGLDCAPKLIDDLANFTSHYRFDIDVNYWERLDEDVVKLIQDNPVERAQFSKIPGNNLKLEDFEIEPLDLAVGGRFIDSDGIRQTLTIHYQAEGQLLFTDELGIRTNLLPVGVLQRYISNGSFHHLKEYQPFSKVFQDTTIALVRIVENQRKAQAKAAEKAKIEAEKLLAQQEKSLKDAKRKAEEIAEKARCLKLKRTEQEKIKQDQVLREQLSHLSLGAWVGIQQDDSIIRYKLAVKFAATGRYIFVDRLGLKKLEFKEDELIAGLRASEISILDDGADFDADLERAVSRLRMSKS